MTDPAYQERVQKMIKDAYSLLGEIDEQRLYSSDPVERRRLARQAEQVTAEIARISGQTVPTTSSGDTLTDATSNLRQVADKAQTIINNTYNVSGQGNTVNTGSGRVINTGGGAYIGSAVNVSGGVNQFGGKMGNVTYNDNRGRVNTDEAKIEELFAQLLQKIETAAASADDKADAKDAAEMLKHEVETARKDPNYKPKRVTMNGLMAAFKNLGAPVASAAMGIIGLPAVGAAINQFAEKLGD